MAFCIQCGETLSLEAKTCPSCARPVGQSSIGAAKERQARPGSWKLVAGVAVSLLVVLGIALAFVLTRGGARREAAAKSARASLVEVNGIGGPVGGVVLRRVGTALVVATQASAAPVGREVKVTKDGAAARGFGFLAAKGKVADEFALVLVPDAGPLVAEEARIGSRPELDGEILAFAADGKLAGSGRVLSFEDGPGAGILVHDAPMGSASRGFGLWDGEGRLSALPVVSKAQGDQLAVAATALFERLLLHEVTIPAGVEWSEHALPIAAGTRVAVALANAGAERLEARVGGSGRVVHAQPVWPGLSALELTAPEAGPLQLGGGISPGPDAARAFVVTFGHL